MDRWPEKGRDRLSDKEKEKELGVVGPITFFCVNNYYLKKKKKKKREKRNTKKFVSP